MKKIGGFFKSFWFCTFLGAFLSFLTVFLLLPQPLFAFQLGSPQAAANIPTWVPTGSPQDAIPPAKPQTSSAQVSPDKDSVITSPSGKVQLTVPKGAVLEATTIQVDEYAPESSSGMQMINRFDLTGSAVTSGKSVTQFSKNLPISITHSADELAGIDTSSLRLYYLDEKTKQWVPLADSKFDSKSMTLTASTNHFTHYGEQANPTIVGPGRVMAAQVNLQSGAAIFNYPLELPAGPGGFKPTLNLNYNSASVDEMKNKQDVGSWVGMGWSLTLGSINRDLNTNQYFLDLCGSSYELFTVDGVNYDTIPAAHYKITRSGNTWVLLDTSGVYYRFGGTTDSQQYLYSTQKDYYRWDLSLIKDTDNNQATISYIQETRGTSPTDWVRYACPEYVNYGNIQVHFISSWDENDATDGHLRSDNPKTQGSNPAPKVMDNRHLDAVEIKVSSNLIRKYTFSYNSTARVYSSDYGGVYYAGNLTLSSITQIGADSTSQLPAITFSYQDKQIFRQTSSDTYVGNPGNPASISWPHLTTVNSGYGGSTSYTYTQIPNTTYYDIWTRESVTAKSIDPGIGSLETTNYTYTGNPQYLGTDWSQKFRGFGEVTETDSAANYVNHYFYTTGTVNGNDAEKLTGKEYDTKYYSSTNALLREVTNTWSWNLPPNSTFHGKFVKNWSVPGPIIQMAQSSGNVYVRSGQNGSTQLISVYDSEGYLLSSWSSGQSTTDMTVTPDGYVLLSDWGGSYGVYLTNGTYLGGSYYGYDLYGVVYGGNGYFFTVNPGYVSEYSYANLLYRYYIYGGGPIIAGNGLLYMMTSSGSVQVFSYSYGLGGGGYLSSQGNSFFAANNKVYLTNGNSAIVCDNYSWDCGFATKGIAASADGYVYVGGNGCITKYLETSSNWDVRLDQTDDTLGGRTRYAYDNYGNVTTQYNDGDTSTNSDDSRVQSVFYPNTTLNILDKPASVVTYSTGSNIVKATYNYYDGHNTSLSTPPTAGNLTRQQSFVDAANSVSSYYTYDSYGNVLTSQDNNGNITTWTYDTTYHLYPATKSYPISGMAESYTFDPGTDNMLSKTNINNQTTYYEYDTFKRQTKTIKPGDSSASPSILYEYGNWGTINQQYLKTTTKVDATHTLWQKQYFDGLGRVIQVHSNGETGYTVISSTTVFNSLGSVDKQYVSQNINSTSLNYTTPDSSWKYTGYSYDGLGRVVTQTNADGTTASHDYSTIRQDLVTNQRGYKTRDYYDAFQRLTKVEELDASQQVYSTTQYSYNVLGDLTQTRDNSNNTTSMTYNWLSRKTAMTDPDMGGWSYLYDNNGNLTRQIDAKNQVTDFTYDALNRVTTKTAYTGWAQQTLKLYPTANEGIGLACTGQWGTNWACVADHPSDEGASYVYATYDGASDWYDVQDHGTAFGTINSISVVVRCAAASACSPAYPAIVATLFQSNGPIVAEGVGGMGTGPSNPSWSNYTGNTFSTNNGAPWTWGDIDSLKIGVILFPGYNEDTYSYVNALCTQEYLQVNYLVPSNPTTVTYTYDDTANGNLGKGQRTGMIDSAGTESYKYDNRGRLTEEKRTISATNYTTGYTYDGANRTATISYPTGETVTNGYNASGLPYSVAGSTVGTLVSDTTYNQLGQITLINLGNTLRTTFGYYGLGGTYDTTGGYYGNLWEIKTLPQSGGTAIQDLQYYWDAGGNMTTRVNAPAFETENFTYDFLDRLTSVSNAYTQSYAYNQIGNITSMNGTSYTYGTKPHAVTAVGSTSYTYDANGNMTSRGGQSLTWNVDNMPTTIGTETYVYDGDGNRIEKIVGGVTILYINKYYEKNVGTGTVTTSYYLGDKLVATRAGTALIYIHQDSLGSSSVTSNSSGTLISSISYFPFGDRRNSQGTIGTDKQFTGQRYDQTGLYYYNARYYDPAIGRFISADDVPPNFQDPQDLNRYTYGHNNPVKFTDPTGHFGILAAMGLGALIGGIVGAAKYAIYDYGMKGNEWNWRTFAGNAAAGAIVGALVVIPGALAATQAFELGAVGTFFYGSASNVLADCVGNGIIGGQKIGGKQIFDDAVIGGAFNVGGEGLSKLIGIKFPVGYEGFKPLPSDPIENGLTAAGILDPIQSAISSIWDYLIGRGGNSSAPVNEAIGWSDDTYMYNASGSIIGFK